MLIPQDDGIEGSCKGGCFALLDVLLCSLVIRGAVLLLRAGELDADPDDYRLLAESFRESGVFGWRDPSYVSGARPTSFRPPLYPTILAALASSGQVTATAVAALHWILGAFTVLLTYLIARHLQLGAWSFLAAFTVACDPILLNQSSLVMTETLATFSAGLALYCLVRSAQCPTLVLALLSGGSLGLATLCRPSFLPWVGLACLVLLGTRATWRSAPVALGLALGWGLVLSPWIAHNYDSFGRATASTTHGGYTLLLGNNPLFYDYLAAGGNKMWDAREFNQAWELRRFSDSPTDELWRRLAEHPERYARGGAPIARNEFEDDRFAYRLALHYIVQQPGMFAVACRVRVGRLWQLVPLRRHQQESWRVQALRTAVGCWYAGLFVLAFYGAVRLKQELLRSPWLWGVLLMLSLTAVHAFYWSNMRMRAPLEPFVCLLAAAGARGLFCWLKEARLRLSRTR